MADPGDHSVPALLDVADMLIVALTNVEIIAKHVLDDDRRNGREALHVICEVVETVRDYLANTLSGDDAQAEMIVLRRSIVDAADPGTKGDPS